MELTIDGQVYEFNFGVGFLKDVNNKIKQPIPGTSGITKNVGLQFAVASILDDDVEELIKVLDIANKGRNPRITQAALEEYIDREDTNIDDLFEETIRFLSQSNATGRVTKKLVEELEKQARER